MVGRKHALQEISGWKPEASVYPPYGEVCFCFSKKGKKHTKYTDEFAFYLFKYLVSKYINIQPKSPT